MINSDKTKQLSDEIREFIYKHGIGISDLYIILNRYFNKQKNIDLAKDAVDQIISDNKNPTNVKAIKLLSYALRDSFGFYFDHKCIKNFWEIIWEKVSIIIGLVVFVISSYMVIGGILEGESNATVNFSMSPIFAMLTLVFLILMLAALEGTQISIVSLKNKELGELKNKYPRSIKINRRTYTDINTQKYLAGRQFFVIFVVFIVAQLTSFNDMKDFPFTKIPVNDYLNPYVNLFLLKLGLLGALIVLWFAQLAPQFIANKNPMLFLNIFGMGYIVKLCMMLENLGLTKPGDWLSSMVQDGVSMPSSPADEYKQLVSEFYGYGILNQSYIWKINTIEEWNFTYKNIFGIESKDIFQIKENSLEIKGESLLPEFENMLLNGNDDERSIISSRVDSISLPDKWKNFEQTLKTNLGDFKIGDSIQSTCSITGSGSIVNGRLLISKPTKYISFRILFSDSFSRIGVLRVNIYKYDELTEKSTLLSKEVIDVTKDKETGLYYLEYTRIYPRVNTFYQLSWSYEK